MIKIRHRGNFNNTERLFKKALNNDVLSVLEKYGEIGVEALAAATPRDTGKTASSWSYEVAKTSSGYSIFWKNSNVNHGIPIAVLIQMGHGTGTGGYVPGRDYINPALASVLDEVADAASKEVTGK